ncbi:MAG: alpha/beta fold hydrolase, partial [Comamonadaceae bacterium]
MNPLDPLPLPHGVQSRTVDNGNGLQMHCLEAGHQTPGRPLLLLLHGFPELAFSWRHQLLPLAAAGFHVVAPDQRGYGRTTGGDARYDGDVAGSRMLNLVEDARGLVHALGYRDVAAVVGHDFGAPVAAWCALLHPDVFRSVALMSAPFAGPPAAPSASLESVLADLAALARPRKHYQWYYATREANADMHGAPQGVHDFLRAYYHHKSADWKG